MSTLITENLQDSGGSVPVATVRRGSAKAWVNFNGTGTVAIRDSQNVASITDNGTGLYAVNITDAMANSDYSAVTQVGGTTSVVTTRTLEDGVARTTLAFRFSSFNTAFSATDGAVQSAVIHGDLA